MHRRFLMRQQIALLLHGIRSFYGLLLLTLVVMGAASSQSVLAQVVTKGGLMGWLLLLSMLVAAIMLILDTVALWLWDFVNSDSAKAFCEHNTCIIARHILATRTGLLKACAWANRRRHWFYLPAASCCLFVIPMSYWLGIKEAAAVQWFYLCMFCGGLGFAVIEGLISNERAKYA